MDATVKALRDIRDELHNIGKALDRIGQAPVNINERTTKMTTITEVVEGMTKVQRNTLYYLVGVSMKNNRNGITNDEVKQLLQMLKDAIAKDSQEKQTL